MEVKQISIPKDLYIPVTFAIYEGIWEAIEKDDPKAKDLVEWYIEAIGFSAYSLVEKLEEKGIKVKLPF
ncbi:MAG: hypothetical protein PWP45_646 [Tepidanaerobacteraceae bacterium]|nr:hypothetical protein [Tepidanaerobacteraceae bacterium]